MWFRAIFEISTRRTGISGKDLQRIMGFGSYKTAWSWLHKLRAAMVRSDSEPLGPFVQVDEALVGGKGGPHKELVLVAAEANGRVRLAHVENNDKDTCKRFADGQIAADANVVTDGHAGYDEKSLGSGPTTRSSRPRRSAASAMPSRAATGRSRCSSAGCSARTPARCATSTCRPTSTSSRSATTAARPTASAGLPPA